MQKLLILAFLCGGSVPAAALDYSLRKEVHHSLERGVAWLAKSQDAKGFWTTPKHPGLTGLVVTALNRLPPGLQTRRSKQASEKAEAFILASVKPDGGIYNADMTNYNTSICMVALIATKNPKYLPVIRNARRFLSGLQQDKGKPGAPDSVLDGGIGYGDDGPYPDLNNTYFALEALRMSKALGEDGAAGGIRPDLALDFLQRCQNLAPSNDLGPVASDSGNKGGFFYSPTESKAGDTVLAGAKVHRSYGAATCMGLLSYVYADVAPADPRMRAAQAWLEGHYTVAGHPGMGMDSYYFYMLALTKALKVLAIDPVQTPAGPRPWKKEAAARLVSIQKSDGSWSNDAGRWWENDPNLASAYAMQALEFCL